MQPLLQYIDNVYTILILSAISVLLIVLQLVHMIRIGKLKKRLNLFLLGRDAKSLEADIVSLYQDNKEVKQSIATNREEIRKLNQEFTFTFQKIGLVKYDAFAQIGGKLSFCLALLDRKNDGFIMNSVHSTDGCYCYTKEIRGGECVVTLSEEELKALKIAVSE